MAVIMLSLVGCGVSQSEYDKLKSENKKQKMELEELKTGEDRLIAVIEKAYKDKKYSLARQNIELLNAKHPESLKNAEFKELLKIVKEKESEERKKREEEEKEKIRLANLNNTGIWSVRYYVDNFGEPTREGYITNTTLIEGKFSNTATQNSDLNVRFLITNSSNISIQLYEYAGNNPVKAYNADSYRVFVQDKEGNRNLFGGKYPEWCMAENSSDRLRLFEENSLAIHKVLMKGGTVKFRIVAVSNTTTHYEFNIQNADYYENAYRKLVEPNAKIEKIQKDSFQDANTGRKYTIQVAEYADEEGAMRFMSALLEKQGYIAKVGTSYRDRAKTRAYYKINVGEYKTFNEAKQANEKFKKQTNISDSFVREMGN